MDDMLRMDCDEGKNMKQRYHEELSEVLLGKPLLIYGAGWTSELICKLMHMEFPAARLMGVIVTEPTGYIATWQGMEVCSVYDLTDEKKSWRVLLAVIDKYAKDIIQVLQDNCVHDIVPFTFESTNLEKLRVDFLQTSFALEEQEYLFFDEAVNEAHYAETGINDMPAIYMVKSVYDKPLTEVQDLPAYIVPLQVGASLTEKRIAEFSDNTGDNISLKNREYCELTAMYWLWKNVKTKQVIGIFHYRRWLDIDEECLRRLEKSEIDVVLPTPLVCFPDVAGVYARDHLRSDWETMLDVLQKWEPLYYETAKQVYKGRYYYGYNMMIVRKNIFDAYCAWLFPLLFEIEARISARSDIDRDSYQKRYVGFLAERLTSLYIQHNRNQLRICHAMKRFLA